MGLTGHVHFSKGVLHVVLGIHMTIMELFISKDSSVNVSIIIMYVHVCTCMCMYPGASAFQLSRWHILGTIHINSKGRGY